MQAWEKFLLKLDQDLGAPTVNKWLRTLKVCNFDACNLYLEAKDSFQVAWFEEHIRSKVNELLLNNNRKKIAVHLTARGGSKKTRKGARGKKAASETNKASPTPPEFSIVFDELDPYARFDHFVFCRENLLAFKLLCDVTGFDPEDGSLGAPETPLATFNPLYLYGPPGTGKTHLLMATTHCLRELGLRAVYARSETFTEHVVSAIRAGEMRQFRQAYRDIDVLIMDDVHVFSRKGATQEEFFHTFNTLHVEGKQIILSASCPPQDLELIEPRLISRFEWGITLGLGSQSQEELAKIARAKASALSFDIDGRVLDYLLQTFKSGSHAVCKAMEALILRSHLRQGEGKQAPPLTAAMAAHVLKDLVEDELRSEMTPEAIIQAVSEHYGIRVEDILSKAQSRECVVPRQVAMHLCRQELKLPYTKIGHLFSRDHSTVMSSCRQVKKKMDKQNSDLLSSMKSISKALHIA
jgi:chromosomal replication initiator protein